MKSLLLTLTAGAAIALTACTGSEQLTDEQKAINEAAEAVAGATVERAKFDVPVTMTANWDTDIARAELDKLVPADAGSPLLAADSLCGNAPVIVGVIEKVADGLGDVPHITHYKQRVGTMPVVVNGDSVSAEMLVDIDWPDTTIDPERHIRHLLNDLVFEALNSQFPQPKDKEAKTPIKPFYQALDEPATMMQHFAGQYSRAYKSLLEAGDSVTPNFAARVKQLARPNLVARLRAINGDWVTYYVATVDQNAAPRYRFVTLNVKTGAQPQATDLVAKENVAALDSAAAAALNAAASRLGLKPAGDKAPYTIALTPEGPVVSRGDGVVVFF